MSAQNWFMYDPGGNGFDVYDSADKAKTAAEAALEMYRDEAGDGWSEEVERLCWGEIKQGTVVVKDEEAPEGSEFDRLVDYALMNCDAGE